MRWTLLLFLPFFAMAQENPVLAPNETTYLRSLQQQLPTQCGFCYQSGFCGRFYDYVVSTDCYDYCYVCMYYANAIDNYFRKIPISPSFCDFHKELCQREAKYIKEHGNTSTLIGYMPPYCVNICPLARRHCQAPPPPPGPKYNPPLYPPSSPSLSPSPTPPTFKPPAPAPLSTPVSVSSPSPPASRPPPQRRPPRPPTNDALSLLPLPLHLTAFIVIIPFTSFLLGM